MIRVGVQAAATARCKPRASGDDPDEQSEEMDDDRKPRASGDDPRQAATGTQTQSCKPRASGDDPI